MNLIKIQKRDLCVKKDDPRERDLVQQCIKIITEIVVNSRGITRFNFLVTWQECATQLAIILILNVTANS
jgi:ABC-type sulfate transport system substrate-binding protein